MKELDELKSVSLSGRDVVARGQEGTRGELANILARCLPRLTSDRGDHCKEERISPCFPTESILLRWSSLSLPPCYIERPRRLPSATGLTPFPHTLARARPNILHSVLSITPVWSQRWALSSEGRATLNSNRLSTAPAPGSSRRYSRSLTV